MALHERSRKTSPQTYARIGGTLYLLIILLGIFYEMIVQNSILVPGDSMATMGSLKQNWTFFKMAVNGIAERDSAVQINPN